MEATQLQTGIAITQSTQGDVDFYLPDGSLGVQKLTPTAMVELTNFDAVVGPALSPVAQYTSIQSALNAVGTAGRILIRPGVYIENVTVSNANVLIQGQGYGIELVGTLTVSTAHNEITSFRVRGNISTTVTTGNKNFMKLWQDTGFSITDSGTDNDIVVITG